MHGTQQNIKCRGCHKVFAKGAGLLQHFESNQCVPLRGYNNPDEFVHQKDMLNVQRALMAMELETQQRDHVPQALWSSTTRAGDSEIVSESAEGGVRIQPSLMDDPVSEKDSLTMNIQPALLGSKDFSDTASVISSSTVRRFNDGQKQPVESGNWPVVGTTDNKGKATLAGSEAGGTSQRMNVQSTWSKNLFPNAPATPAYANLENEASVKLTADSLNSATPSESGIHSIPAGRLLEPDLLDNVYHCPLPKCE